LLEALGLRFRMRTGEPCSGGEDPLRHHGFLGAALSVITVPFVTANRFRQYSVLCVCARINPPFTDEAVVEATKLEESLVRSMSVESHTNPQGEGTSRAKNQGHELSPCADFEREEHELKEIERRILGVSGVKRDLNKLARAGADQKKVVTLLALAVFSRNGEWRHVAKQKSKALKTLAKQFRALTDRAERLAEDPLCGPDFWGALLGMITWEQVQWPTKSDPTSPFGSMMRTLATNAERKAALLGKVIRRGAFYERRLAVVALSCYIQKSTGRNYDNMAARLLTDAYEAMGSRHEFSEDQVKKLRQRHMPPSS
jgi:hypothetical protein